MGEEKKPKRLDDYVQMGKYVIFVCIFTELSILPEVTSQFYMVYAGASPRVASCRNQTFPSELEDKEVCNLYKETNCSNPVYEYQFYSVNVEWDYFCDLSKQVKNSIPIQMFGVLVGSVVFGQLSDNFGRKHTMLIALMGMAISSIAVAHSQDLFQFTITRTITGFFTGASISIINVYIVENVPKEHRMWLNMLITWSPNMPPIAFIAWLSHRWDVFAYANALMCIPPLLFGIFFIHESPRWLITKDRVDEAREIIRKQLELSDQLHLMDDEFEQVLRAEHEFVMSTNSKKKQYSYFHLFNNWTLAMTTTVIAFSYFATSILNYGILFNMEKLSGSIYWNLVYTGLMRYACNIIFGYADLKFKKVGRKFIHTSGLVVVLCCLLPVVFAYALNLNHTLSDVIRYSILLGSSMTSQVYIADGIVGNEMFPTPIRNVGYSFLQMCNRFGGIVSPFVFYLQDIWIGLPYCVLLFLSTIDLFAFECLLPETKGKPLVEHMPQKRIFGKRQKGSDQLLAEKLVENGA